MLLLESAENAMPVTLALFIGTVVLGVVLGFLVWGRWRKLAVQKQGELDELNAKHDELMSNHQALEELKAKLDKDLDQVRKTVNRIESENIKLHAQIEELNANH